MRIGQGIDAHQLVAGRPLVLGGVEIPFERGLEGHSDGDALLHAVASALIGALGVDTENVRDDAAHFLEVFGQLRRLSDDRGVEIHQPIAALPNALSNPRKDLRACNSGEARI